MDTTTEQLQLIEGEDSEGRPANIGVGISDRNQLVVATPPGVGRVHLTPQQTAKFVDLVRSTNRVIGDNSW